MTSALLESTSLDSGVRAVRLASLLPVSAVKDSEEYQDKGDDRADDDTDFKVGHAALLGSVVG